MFLIDCLTRIINLIRDKDERLIVFIPHGGCKADKYSVWNYKSDNSLSFMNYMIATYGNDYKYRIAVDYRELGIQKNKLISLYPNLDINCFPFFHICGNRLLLWKHKFLNMINVFSRAKYIFSSEVIHLPIKSSKQKYIILGYYIPFKNDYNLSYINHLANDTANKCDYYITSSLLSSQIISHTYGIPLCKFKVLGFSRNDNLLLKADNNTLRQYIQSQVDYNVKKILLYTPTHRDYERLESQINKRGFLGFNISKKVLEEFLKIHGLVIIGKLHSAQNIYAIRQELPKGVICWESNELYGLCELMQISDALLTDYTSAYFDYLLLDKPVIFNFYDFDKYLQYRGFSYDPIESILAGDIINDEESFYCALDNLVKGNDCWREKRLFVKNLVHKYQDSSSSVRICDFIFGK